MKSLLLAAAISLAAMPALAGEHVCQSIGRLADSIITARQIGVPLSEIMAVSTDQPDVDALARALAMLAYNEPNYSVPENRAEQRREFVNSAEHACYKRIN